MKQWLRRVTIGWLTGLTLILVGASLALAQPDKTPEAGKQIGVVPPSEPLSVSFAPEKNVYQVGEPIQFRVKGNKEFYLYLFAIDTQKNIGIVLFPNAITQDNRLSTPAEVVIPSKEKFVSDSPGVEKVIMLASTTPQKIDPNMFAKAGIFFTAEASTTERAVRAISVQAAEKGDPPVIKEVELVIAGQGPPPLPAPSLTPPPPRPPEAVPFISADKTQYRIGEPMKIVFGADRPGVVFLCVQEPSGKPILLQRQPVSGQENQQVVATTSPPTGPHTLVALYDVTGRLPDDQVLSIVSNQAKGVQLTAEKRWPMAVFRFEIIP